MDLKFHDKINWSINTLGQNLFYSNFHIKPITLIMSNRTFSDTHKPAKGRTVTDA